MRALFPPPPPPFSLPFLSRSAIVASPGNAGLPSAPAAGRGGPAAPRAFAAPSVGAAAGGGGGGEDFCPRMPPIKPGSLAGGSGELFAALFHASLGKSRLGSEGVCRWSPFAKPASAGFKNVDSIHLASAHRHEKQRGAPKTRRELNSRAPSRGRGGEPGCFASTPHPTPLPPPDALLQIAQKVLFGEP